MPYNTVGVPTSFLPPPLFAAALHYNHQRSYNPVYHTTDRTVCDTTGQGGMHGRAALLPTTYAFFSAALLVPPPSFTLCLILRHFHCRRHAATTTSACAARRCLLRHAYAPSTAPLPAFLLFTTAAGCLCATVLSRVGAHAPAAARNTASSLDPPAHRAPFRRAFAAAYYLYRYLDGMAENGATRRKRRWYTIWQPRHSRARCGFIP